MKKILSICLTVLAIGAYGQSDNVGIGTTNPDNSAILDLSSSDKGFLLPRMTKDQRLGINNPAQGLQVFQTNEESGLYVFNGTEWTTSANSIAAATDPWLLGGNSITSGDFIGTNNNENLVFKVGGTQAGLLSVDNRTFYGLLAGAATTGAHNIAIGFLALQSNINGIRNTAIGSRALNLNTGSDNLALGMDALQNNTTGGNNTAIGLSSLNANQTGELNVGIGTASLGQQTSGNFNVGLGFGAGFGNATGSSNIAIGGYSLFANSAGASNNLAIGFQAGRNATGSNNIFIGKDAGKNETNSDRLYLSNSDTNTPLIYGNFAAKFVSIGDVDPAKREAANTSGGYNLLVKGGILTEKVKVALASSNDWADYVFEDDYNLMSLNKVEEFITENKHLPNVPSADELAQTGLDVATTNKMLMEKIEELTLYVIQLNKEIKELKK